MAPGLPSASARTASRPLWSASASANVLAMGILLVFVALGGLIWLAIRITRRQIALGDLADALSADRRKLVAVDPSTGAVRDATGDLAMVAESWHPVRFPEGWESRSAGFPSERAAFDRTLGSRRHWCETKCRGAWRVERADTASPVFWFEDRRDAAAFTLQWFPFKCS